MKKYYILTLLILLYTSVSSQVTPTNDWISFYSDNSTFDGENLDVGDVVEAFDSDSTLCGRFIVHTKGYMGYLHVYGDDLTTSDIDEGAEPGDIILFKINNSFTLIEGGSLPTWDGNREVLNISLEAKSNWDPVISEIPAQVSFEGTPFNELLLDSYVYDYNNSKEELVWSSDGSEHLQVDITNQRTAIVTQLDSNWFGEESIIFNTVDPLGGSSNITVGFTVLNINDAPVITNLPDTISFRADSVVSLNMTDFISDIDNDFSDLNIEITSSSDSILTNYSSDTGILLLSAEETYSGLSELYITAVDDSNATAENTLVLNIIDITTGLREYISGTVPVDFILYQNYPNPFNPETTIQFTLPQSSYVKLDIFDSIGRQVETLISSRLDAGNHQVRWNAELYSSGIYIYRLNTGNLTQTRKLILLE